MWYLVGSAIVVLKWTRIAEAVKQLATDDLGSISEALKSRSMKLTIYINLMPKFKIVRPASLFHDREATRPRTETYRLFQPCERQVYT
jgi:hypothetical protein